MNRPTTPTVLACMALFFSMGGTGLAANHYLITNVGQIKPSVVTQLRAATATVKASPGPAGASGSQGPQGTAGPQGQQGTSGAPGSPGLEGARGATGPKGETGSTGVRGETGATGPEGKTPEVSFRLSPYSEETALSFDTEYTPSASSVSEVVLTLSWDPGKLDEEEWSAVIIVGGTRISTVYLKDVRETGQESWAVTFPVPAGVAYKAVIYGDSTSVELHGATATWEVR